MKKNIKKDIFCSILTSIVCGELIAIVISLCIGDGKFYATSPDFALRFSSEIKAVIFQFFCLGLFGVVVKLASFVWDKERWSLLKQTAIHFCIIFFTLTPLGFICDWLPPPINNSFWWGTIISWCIEFIAIYIFIWLIIYISNYIKIVKINKKLKSQREK